MPKVFPCGGIDIAESCPKGQKMLWEMDELLGTSKISFSLSVVERLVDFLLTHDKNKGLFGKWLNNLHINVSLVQINFFLKTPFPLFFCVHIFYL